MIFILRRLLLLSMIKLYAKAWSVINVIVMMLSFSGYYLMSLFIESVIIYDSALDESVKAETGLFYIADKRLNNIIWGSL